MGADGGIRIYDMRELKEGFGAAETKKFMEVIRDSMSYFHEIKFRKLEPIPVLTVYQGDNIYVPSLFQKIEWSEELDEWDLKNLNRNNMPLELLRQMVEFLNERCLIGDWEVWT